MPNWMACGTARQRASSQIATTNFTARDSFDIVWEMKGWQIATYLRRKTNRNIKRDRNIKKDERFISEKIETRRFISRVIRIIDCSHTIQNRSWNRTCTGASFSPHLFYRFLYQTGVIGVSVKMRYRTRVVKKREKNVILEIDKNRIIGRVWIRDQRTSYIHDILLVSLIYVRYNISELTSR